MYVDGNGNVIEIRLYEKRLNPRAPTVVTTASNSTSQYFSSTTAKK